MEVENKGLWCLRERERVGGGGIKNTLTWTNHVARNEEGVLVNEEMDDVAL